MFSKPVALLRNRPQPGFANEAVTRIFQVDATKLPAYVGTASERGGFSIYRLVKVVSPPEVDPAKVAAARAEDRRACRTASCSNAYVNTLKAKAEGRDQPGQPREEVGSRRRSRGRGRRCRRCSVVARCFWQFSRIQ